MGDGEDNRWCFLFGPARDGVHPTFLQFVKTQLAHGGKTSFWADEIRNGVALCDVSEVFKQAVIGKWSGIFHLGGPEALSRVEFARRVAQYMGLDSSQIEGVPRASVIDPTKPPLSPLNISMSVEKVSAALGQPLNTIEDALRIMGV